MKLQLHCLMRLYDTVLTHRGNFAYLLHRRITAGVSNWLATSDLNSNPTCTALLFQQRPYVYNVSPNDFPLSSDNSPTVNLLTYAFSP
jgi:hypothetical protein